MKNNVIIGGLLIVVGLVLILSGKLLGALVLVAGIGVIFLGYAKLMRGNGYHPDQATLNGFGGMGKQQPDAVKESQPVIGEQPANIWDQLENKK